MMSPLGWRPSLVAIVGCWPSLVGWRPSLVGFFSEDGSGRPDGTCTRPLPLTWYLPAVSVRGHQWTTLRYWKVDPIRHAETLGRNASERFVNATSACRLALFSFSKRLKLLNHHCTDTVRFEFSPL